MAIDDILALAKKAFTNKSKSQVNRLYKEMSKEQMEMFREFIKKQYSPLKVTEDGINNIQALYNNKKLLQSLEHIPMSKKLAPDLISGIKNDIKKEIGKSKDYFSEIQNLLFDENKVIKDFGVYGEIVDALEGSALEDGTKKLLRQQVGINNGINLKNDLSIKDKEAFISKTFKGDSKKQEDVDDYLSKISAYLGLGDKDSEMYQEMQNIVSNKGNILKSQEAYERKVLEKQRKSLEAAANNQPKVKNNKADIDKKKTKTLREATGTEGGTLTDFAKGHRGNLLNVAFSTIGAVAEYKEGRNEGKTVLGSAADAAISFAAGEVLGLKGMLVVGAVKGVTTLGLKGAKYAMDSSRSMNNIQRFTPFADAQFQDTQQLATMRQSGMELAKMSQYNLQQTLMGAEARHLHR